MRASHWVTVVLLAAYLPACTSYQVVTDPAAALQPAPDQPGKVRVTTSDGRKIPVKRPTIYGDSLRGMSERKKPVSLAMADIVMVEVQRSSTSKSVALGLGIAVAAGIIVGLVLLSNADFGL